nr:immunoglobulin heavy chain junction region [Mus musculus]
CARERDYYYGSSLYYYAMDYW